MGIDFGTWLRSQIDREDDIGDLAESYEFAIGKGIRGVTSAEDNRSLWKQFIKRECKQSSRSYYPKWYTSVSEIFDRAWDEYYTTRVASIDFSYIRESVEKGQSRHSDRTRRRCIDAHNLSAMLPIMSVQSRSKRRLDLYTLKDGWADKSEDVLKVVNRLKQRGWLVSRNRGEYEIPKDQMQDILDWAWKYDELLSGKQILFRRRKTQNHEDHKMVQIFRDGDDLAIVTDAPDERAFVEGMSAMLAGMFQNGEDETGREHEYRKLIPQIADLCARYRGYKANVTEKRLLIAGNVLRGQLQAEVNGRGELQVVAPEIETAQGDGVAA